MYDDQDTEVLDALEKNDRGRPGTASWITEKSKIAVPIAKLVAWISAPIIPMVFLAWNMLDSRMAATEKQLSTTVIQLHERAIENTERDGKIKANEKAVSDITNEMRSMRTEFRSLLREQVEEVKEHIDLRVRAGVRP